MLIGLLTDFAVAEHAVGNVAAHDQLLHEAVAAGLAAGQSLEEMRTNIEIPEYEHWGGYSWLNENVLGMYHFLTD